MEFRTAWGLDKACHARFIYYDPTLRTQGGGLLLVWILVDAAVIVVAMRKAEPPLTNDMRGRFILIKLHEI